jgi:hypothetical protein
MIGGAALAASLALAPAMALTAQQQQQQKKSRKLHVPSPMQIGSIGSFTPAVADPRLAAAFARRGFQSGFRFTPSAVSQNKSKAVRVAVRARSGLATDVTRIGGDASPAVITAVTPTAYNLGVAIGWRRFALSGDVAKVQGGILPGGHEAAEVGVSYSGKKFAGLVEVGAERTDGLQQSVIAPESSYSLDVGGSYSISRRLNLTGGVRYKIQRDRLAPLADERRDSQAVYIGTAFRF